MMTQKWQHLMMAVLVASLTACAQLQTGDAGAISVNDYVKQLDQADQARLKAITSVTAELELTTADGAHTHWTAANTLPDNAARRLSTPTGDVRIFARPTELLTYVAVSLIQPYSETLTTAAGDSIQFPLGTVELGMTCRIAKGETCVVRDAKDQALVAVRWKN